MSQRCPECESEDTDKEFVDFYRDEFIVTFTCSNCPTQFTAHYMHTYTETDWTEREEEEENE